MTQIPTKYRIHAESLKVNDCQIIFSEAMGRNREYFL